MTRAVRFHEYGDLDVLRIEDVTLYPPSNGEVAVRVRSAGVNPGEAAIRSGALAEQFAGSFPSGQGTEFSGRVSAVGPDVVDVGVGDAVIGFSDGRDAQADEVVLPADHVLPMPSALGWDIAATTPIAGATATAMVETVRPRSGETVVVAGGAGGVGYAAVQLALRTGATVVATAAPADHAALRAVGAVPVAYGDGVEDRIREVAPDGVDAFLDTHGEGQADIAVALGVAPDRVDTIIDFDAAQRLGIRTDGMYQLPDIRAAVVAFVELVVAGALRSPVKAAFPLKQVKEAYRALADAPGVGKVVLTVSTDEDAGAVGN